MGKKITLVEDGDPNLVVVHQLWLKNADVVTSARIPGALRGYAKKKITGFDIFNAFEKYLRRGFVTLNDITEASKRNRKKKAIKHRYA